MVYKRFNDRYKQVLNAALFFKNHMCQDHTYARENLNSYISALLFTKEKVFLFSNVQPIEVSNEFLWKTIK